MVDLKLSSYYDGGSVNKENIGKRKSAQIIKNVFNNHN